MATPAPVQRAFASTSSDANTSVNTASNTDSVDTTPFGSNCTAGNLIFYSVGYDGEGGGGGQPTVAITDSRGNAYTKIASFFDATNDLYSEFGYAKNIAGGATTVTATFSGSVASSYFKGISALEISGLDTVAPFTIGEDAIANLSIAASTGFSTGNTAALAESNGFMVGVASQLHNLNGPATAGSGFTQFGSAFWNFGGGTEFALLETKTLSSNAAQAATFTSGAAGFSGHAYAAVFKPAGSGGGAALAGAGTDALSAAGVLSTAIKLAGAATSLVSAVGALTTAINLGRGRERSCDRRGCPQHRYQIGSRGERCGNRDRHSRRDIGSIGGRCK